MGSHFVESSAACGENIGQSVISHFFCHGVPMFRFRSLLLSLLISSVVIAADDGDKPKPPPRPEPPQPVNVVKTDGKVVGGLLTKTDHSGLTVKPIKGGDELMIPWYDVKSTSNSMTRATWLAKFKKLNADKLCNKCKGDALMQCPDCKGTGVDPAQAKACEKCKGTGGVGPCPNKNCKDGKIDCPNTCLKLSQGPWVKDGDMTIRKFPDKDGHGWHGWSTHHLGELIVKENGEYVNKGTCPTCGGTTKIDDPICKGKGVKLCPDCKGNGVIGPADPACDHGFVKCDECKGTGLQGS
jgi:hypothetical protein